MTPPDPRAALWRPSFLHELDLLAQSAADSAGAALESDAIPTVAGARFLHAYRKLHNQLKHFRQFDPDDPTSWPAKADAALLFALLNILHALESLEPPVLFRRLTKRGKKQPTFDVRQIAANLKELRPSVTRLQKVVKSVHQLIVNKLADSPASNVAQSATPNVPIKTQDTLSNQTARHSNSDEATIKPLVQKALLVIHAHPDWTVQQVADEVGCCRSHLYRFPVIKNAFKLARRSKKDLVRGYKATDGSLEAWPPK